MLLAKQVKNTFIDVEEESPDSIRSLHDRGAKTCTARMSPSGGFFDEQPDAQDTIRCDLGSTYRGASG